MIRFENVSKTYDGQRRAALDNINVDIDKGEFVFLVGASGSGKSTFLRLILREQRPSQGKVFVAGRELNKLHSWKIPAMRRQIGTVFQDFQVAAEQDGDRERRLRPSGDRQAGFDHQSGGPRGAGAGRSAGQGRPAARGAVRRGAAAGGDRPRVRQPADDPDRRRADRKPRSRPPASGS